MNQRIDVSSPTQRLEVNPGTQRVVVINAGPQGPPGVSGGGAGHFEYNQVVPASSWVINHNLGFRPNITVEEEATGHEILCAEIHHSAYQVELQFNTPRAGTAHLS